MEIAAFARGLNQLLKAGNMGAGLRNAADVLAPVIDVRHMIGAQNRRFVSGTSANPPAGGLQVASPAVGEIWWVHYFGANIITDATGSTAGSFIGMRAAGSGAEWLPLTQGVDATFGVNSRRAVSCQPNLLSVPGDIWAIVPNQVSNNHTWEWAMLYDVYEGTP